jgi:glycine cleavage system H lipoate-binding protein/ABC-type phosphate transport system substrate-binding protein
MKNSTLLFIGLLLLVCAVAYPNKNEARKNPASDHTLNIGCTPGLYNLTGTWADEFCKSNPGVKIEVNSISGFSSTGNTDFGGNSALISSKPPVPDDLSMWHVVIGRDVTVPVFNPENPFANELCQQGISPEEFAQLFTDPGKRYWGTLINRKEDIPVNVYMVDDESIHSGMARWMGLDQSRLEGTTVENGEALIFSVQNDPYSIGFCKISDILDPDGQSISESIKLLPLDRNNNGSIDYMEDVYGDLSALSRGVWTGKYPKALVSNLYFISPEKPAGGQEKAFLKWILTEGQQFSEHQGISGLLYAERRTKMSLLDDHELNIIAAAAADERSGIPVWLWFILGSFGFFFFTMIGVNLRRISYSINAGEEFPARALKTAPPIDEHMIEVPKGIYYGKTHTWAYMEKDGSVRFGIDDFLQHITGPITRIRMKSRGEKVRQGSQVLSIIQNGKQLNIHTPVSGTIREQNRSLAKKPSLINTSPYSDGWVYIIEPSNWLKESQFMIMWQKYKEWLKSEFSRLKDFLALCVKPDTEYAHVLQDGGVPRDGVLEDLGPEVWEDFQTSFLDLPA